MGYHLAVLEKIGGNLRGRRYTRDGYVGVLVQLIYSLFRTDPIRRQVCIRQNAGRWGYVMNRN